jgi:hypothetical protein
MGYLGALGKLIHEKNQKSKISCQTPFKLNKLQRLQICLRHCSSLLLLLLLLCRVHQNADSGWGKVGMLWY